MIDRPTKLGADDHLDMVVITLGDLKPQIPYQQAFELVHAIRIACKAAARHDRAPANFWLEMDLEDLEDCPAPHNGFRRSREVPNVTRHQVLHQDAEIAILFDGRGTILGYEDGIRVHHMIRRAARRAKAWAGDATRGFNMRANLTDAEDDYRLGL